MVDAGEESRGRLAPLVAELADEVGESRLTEKQWAVVGELVGRLEAAVASGHGLAMERALVELEGIGPFRAVKAGSVDHVAQPEPLRERLAVLVHTLQASAAAVAREGLERQHPDEQPRAAR
ncbi:hypothetical protein KDL01_12515 [Actinospica durhamensis]|uniref:CATRA-Associated Small Protein domain-containing protein n=1 Tax=Actinospica durhamensis TaxID=1508375 RepID=A0A941EUF3_9ACTN|nr:CATRA system-associated protein [Actinospica durhamensis]MBR7834094.1 hypothetical protein [Actinospica durhamensis]